MLYHPCPRIFLAIPTTVDSPLIMGYHGNPAFPIKITPGRKQVLIITAATCTFPWSINKPFNFLQLATADCESLSHPSQKLFTLPKTNISPWKLVGRWTIAFKMLPFQVTFVFIFGWVNQPNGIPFICPPKFQSELENHGILRLFLSFFRQRCGSGRCWWQIVQGIVLKAQLPGSSVWPFWDGEFTWPFRKLLVTSN